MTTCIGSDTRLIAMHEKMQENVDTPNNSLRLSWSLGFSKDLIHGVHNLSTDTFKAVFYPAAHTGIIYNISKHSQTFLQGHCSPISACTASEDKRWIVTADRGEESMIVVWDATTGDPVKTIYQPHANGVLALDLTPDALFLVTLSAIDESSSDGDQQELSIWQWTNASKQEDSPTSPLYTSIIATDDVQSAVRFNTSDVREMITTGKQRVIFWSWRNRRLAYYSPSLKQKNFRQSIGDFTQSIFVPDSMQALTGTQDGDLILWDSVDSSGANASKSLDRKAVKVVRVTGNANEANAAKVAITCISDEQGFVVIGASDGSVRFYDYAFRLAAWFEDINAGPITSVSFAYNDEAGRNAEEQCRDILSVPDFVVGTSLAFIVDLQASLFTEHIAEKRHGTLIMQGINDEIHGLAFHPIYQQLAVASCAGVVQLWNHNTRRLVMMRKFDAEKFKPQCVTFSADGRRLFVGSAGGHIKLLHGQSLQEAASFTFTKGVSITDIRVSPDSSLLVAIDSDAYVGMWRANFDPSQFDLGTDSTEDALDENQQSWVFLGRCKSHSERITGITFGTLNDGSTRLISVARDKYLVEYSLERSSVMEGIVLEKTPERVEETAVPTAICWYPQMEGAIENLIVLANDAYKIKLYNAHNKMCRKTTLGPTYGGPINWLKVLPRKNALKDSVEERYCLYTTQEKIVGILKLPFDGNPHKCMGVIAHPGIISNADVSPDGKFFATAGGIDLTVNIWEIDSHHMDVLEDEGGEGLRPYYDLMEGGRDGELYNDIVDYFYYAEIRMQGVMNTQAREIHHRISVSSISDIMRALGYFPSEREIADILSQVKYSNYTATALVEDTISFEDFVRLYLNHRPVLEVSKSTLEEAFRDLIGTNGETSSLSLSWEELKVKLLELGEKMSEFELEGCLCNLGVTETVHRDNKGRYTASSFADAILGFEDYEADQPQS